MSPYEDAYQLMRANFVGFQRLNILNKWKKLERNFVVD